MAKNWCRELVGQVSDISTYAANLCPNHCGGETSDSRPRTTILHSDDGDGKGL
jgi:hypothetical protein